MKGDLGLDQTFKSDEVYTRCNILKGEDDIMYCFMLWDV